jgi:hypothetical protein
MVKEPADYERLSELSGFEFRAYTSPEIQTEAQTIATRCNRAFVFLRDVFQVHPILTLLVLTIQDWEIYTQVQPIGMPHFEQARLIVAGQTTPFWESFVPERATASPDYFRAVEAVYGRPDGTLDVSRFFHLLAIHELGHAFHMHLSAAFPRLWLMETFANLCLHTYIAENEPELLPALETLPQGFINIPEDLIQYRSLRDFELHYDKMHPANYGWYQGKFHGLAKQAYDLRGIQALRSFWDTFVLSDAQVNALLQDNVHSELVRTVENWPDSTPSVSRPS